MKKILLLLTFVPIFCIGMQNPTKELQELLNARIRGTKPELEQFLSKAVSLVAKGAYPNLKSVKSGESLLMMAAQSENSTWLSQLLQLGADPNYNPGGLSALWEAIILNNFNNTKILLESGADPMQKTNAGQVLLDLARIQGNQEIINLLLRQQSKIK